MKKAGVNVELKVWDNAGHAFMNQDSPKYVPEVAKEALAEVINWLKKNLV
jgi:dienelactone hydrolase